MTGLAFLQYIPALEQFLMMQLLIVGPADKQYIPFPSLQVIVMPSNVAPAPDSAVNVTVSPVPVPSMIVAAATLGL